MVPWCFSYIFMKIKDNLKEVKAALCYVPKEVNALVDVAGDSPSEVGSNRGEYLIMHGVIS